MRISTLMQVGSGRRFAFQVSRLLASRLLAGGVGCVLLALSSVAMAQSPSFVLERKGRVISLEPFGANIVRVTMSTDKAAATAAPGYGFVATPSVMGWTHERDAEGSDVFRSAKMVVRVAPGDLPPEKLPQPMPLDALNRQLREPYFGGGGGQGPYNDSLQVSTPGGKMLLHMRTWAMAPERADVAQHDFGAKGYSVTATFDSPADEHYYGLGQQQKGWMDLRDHEMCVYRSWSQAAVTGWCGTTHRKRQLTWVSTDGITGRQRLESVFHFL
jgi:alpha-D-xyloside xylohydrolase